MSTRNLVFRNFRSLAIAFFWWFGFCRTSSATLIIAVRHNNDIYMASDGMLYNPSKGSFENHIKCFRISETCCVGLSGFCGDTSPNNSVLQDDKLSTLFPLALDEISSQQRGKREACRLSVANVARQFQSHFDLFRTFELQNGNTSFAGGGSNLLHFIGYDATCGAFIEQSVQCFPSARILEPLNSTIVPKPYLSIQGETAFLSALFAGTNPNVVTLLPSEVHAVFLKLAYTDEYVPEKLTISTLLEFYKLQKRYGGTYHSGDGYVGPPYVIYRISTTNVSRIYYGDGTVNSDKVVISLMLCGIILALIVSVIIYALKA